MQLFSGRPCFLNITLPPKSVSRPFQEGNVSHLVGTQKAVAEVLSQLLKGYLSSLRVRNLAAVRRFWAEAQEAHLIFSYHSRSLLGPWFLPLLAGSRPVNCLISPSKMAAWEAVFFQQMGFKAIRGSTSRRGVHATREILAALRRGEHVGLTPDGPRGPAGRLRAEAAKIARLADAPVVLVAPVGRLVWRLPTWDRHFVPRLGQSLDLRLLCFPRFSEGPWSDDAAIAERWTQEFLAATGEGRILRVDE